LRVKTREEVTMTEPTTPSRSRSQDAPAPGLGRGGRMSRRRKLTAVLRLLRGDDLELVSRELGVTAARLTGWRDDFLAAGEAALGTRERDDRELQIDRLRAKVGELTIANELLEAKVEHLEDGRPLARRRSRR
jgi:transposase